MSNLITNNMSNRLTFMERLSERLTALEAIIRKLEPVESFLERVELLEKNIYATKKVFYFFGSMHVHRGIRKYAV